MINLSFKRDSARHDPISALWVMQLLETATRTLDHFLPIILLKGPNESCKRASRIRETLEERNGNVAREGSERLRRTERAREDVSLKESERHVHFAKGVLSQARIDAKEARGRTPSTLSSRQPVYVSCSRCFIFLDNSSTKILQITRVNVHIPPQQSSNTNPDPVPVGFLLFKRSTSTTRASC